MAKPLCKARTAAAAAALALLFTACSKPATPARERIAVLRFENLGSDVSADWMGRALSEVVTEELSGIPGIYAIPSRTFHSSEGVLGPRPVTAPGISAESALAQAASANRVAYGEYSSRTDAIEVRLTLEDPQTNRVVRVLSASGPAGDLIAVASRLAHRISARAGKFPTSNAQALKAYVTAMETGDPAASDMDLQEAIAADPNYGPAYRELARLRVDRQDRSGALAVLDRALARAAGLPEVERARVEVEAATLRNDTAARQRALLLLVKLAPEDPTAWRSLAENAMNHHTYSDAAEAYRKLLAWEPDDAGALNQLAYASAYLGDTAAAVSALRRYQTLRPADPNPLDSLGDVNLIAGRLGDAEKFYLDAARKDPAFQNGGDAFKAAMARLMTGDVAGADELANQFFSARAAARDPLVDVRKAEWQWVMGRRKAAREQMQRVAGSAEKGGLRDVAATAYAQLAMWSLMMGRADEGAGMARKSAALAGPASAATAIMARFLAQPAASAAEWAARADRLAPGSQNPLKQMALIAALLLGRQFQPASLLLREMYESGSTADEGLPIILAWTYAETGHVAEAAPLLRFDPIPPPGGAGLFTPFSFPRIFYLRAGVAERQGKPEEARANYRLFAQLSGPDPLLWGEERDAARRIGQ